MVEREFFERVSGPGRSYSQHEPPGQLLSRACGTAMESFWSTLKRELVHRCQFATCAEARAVIFEWIEVFYNRERFHSTLGYNSLVDFETKLN